MKARHASTTTADNTAQPATGIAKHTAGPWHVQTVNGKTMVACQPFGNGEGCLQIAEVTAFKSKGRTKANAKLIAAAPELLELLKLTYGKCRIGYDEALIARSRAAIAKAETLA